MSGRRLLILDDDPSIGQTMGLIAETVRFDTRFTTDPERFFALVDEWTPTHIALDLVMPSMDGVEVMVQLARRGCRARIIVTSGVGSRVLDAAGRSAEEHGLDIAGVLAKPFSPAALRALLADAPLAPGAIPGAGAGDGATFPLGGFGAELSATFVVTVDDLRRALADHEIEVHYQPKIDCATGRLAGFEALVRWRHPQRGLVSPGGFVRVAEEGGVIDALTDRVLDLSLPWFGRSFPGPAGAGAVQALQVEGTVSLSVNISARSLRDLQLADRIDARCAAAGIAPSRLILELTETSAMEDPVASLDLLTRLRMKGFQLSIDDFGTAALLRDEGGPLLRDDAEPFAGVARGGALGGGARPQPGAALHRRGGGGRARAGLPAPGGLRPRPGLPDRPADAGGGDPRVARAAPFRKTRFCALRIRIRNVKRWQCTAPAAFFMLEQTVPYRGT